MAAAPTAAVGGNRRAVDGGTKAQRDASSPIPPTTAHGGPPAFSLMSTQHRAKRPRIHQPDAAPAQAQLPGRDQLLLKSPELQSRLGQRY
jgi:hypothetical protein